MKAYESIYLTENTRKNHNYLLALIIFQKGVEHRKFDNARTPDLQYHLSAFRGTRISASQNWQYRISGSFNPPPTPTPTPTPRPLRLNGVYRCGEGEDGVRFKKYGLKSLVLLRTGTKPIPTILSSLYASGKNSELTFENSDFDA